MEIFTIGPAKEVAAEGIRVNAVRPASSTLTSMQAAANPSAPSSLLPRYLCNAPVRRKRWRPSCGHGRTIQLHHRQHPDVTGGR